MEVHLDRLPLKRVESTDEAGLERFPADTPSEEKRLDLIRRIDFSWVVDKDEGDKATHQKTKKKKKKKSEKETALGPPWPWLGLVENLQLAHQELAVVIDLIHTVEANDAVTVAGMTRPKQLPNELLSDLSVSAATKLQKLRHLGKYFKQSAKALEKQVDREARFYGSLLRLQDNWKVKRQRQPVPGNEGFSFDLHDASSFDYSAVPSRPPSTSMVRVDHDPSGMLALQSTPRPCRRLHFGFSLEGYVRKSLSAERDDEDNDVMVEAPTAEVVDRSARRTHRILRKIHRAIFEEQVFDSVNREAVDAPSSVNVAGMREDYLRLKIGPETSIYFCLQSSEGEAQEGAARSDSLVGSPDLMSFEIGLHSLYQERAASKGRQPTQGVGILGYFCAVVAHRVFSKKVYSQLECLVEGLPYLCLQTHPTWHSRRSSWSLNISIPQLVVNPGARGGAQARTTDVEVNDELISIRGEGVPSTFGSSSGDGSAVNCYGCNLEDLPGILLQQIITQVVGWLHDEAEHVGIKSSMDFLALRLELGGGEKVRLAAQLDVEAERGGISWWLGPDDDVTSPGEESQRQRKFLGSPSLESLYSFLMDLLCFPSSNMSNVSQS